MKKCDYFKKSINKCKCKLSNDTITLLDCIKCTKFKQTSVSSINITPKSKRAYKGIKIKSSKVSKLENSRTHSLFTNDLEHCYLCGGKKDHLHEVFFGANRLNSIRYNLFIPVCFKCHLECHNNKELIGVLHKKGQFLFQKEYKNLNFTNIFCVNYLDF